MQSQRLFQATKFKIRYETWGDPSHKPVLFFHGFPGSHIQAQGLAPLVDDLKIFLVAADRPGYGGTVGKGTPLDYLKDLSDLLTHLKAPTFHIIGLSGGAPWGHIMGSHHADRIESMIVVCGLGPFNKETKSFFKPDQKKGLMIGRWFPEAAAAWLVNRVFRDLGPEDRIERFLEMLDETDRTILSDPARKTLLLTSMQHARSQGATGIVNDAKLYHQDWLSNFCDLEKLKTIPTTFFHGKKDLLLDPRMSEWMHKKHGQSKLTMFDDEGHYSLPFQRAREILALISS